MGLIVEHLKVEGDKGKGEVTCLFDTGSSETLMREDIAERISTLINLPQPLYLKMADGEGVIEAKKCMPLSIAINGCVIRDDVIVVSKLDDEMIIGTGTMQKYRIKLDLENEKVLIDPKVMRLRV
ncbi:MAG: retropepsin-like aspartic protease [bacterium]